MVLAFANWIIFLNNDRVPRLSQLLKAVLPTFASTPLRRGLSLLLREGLFVVRNILVPLSPVAHLVCCVLATDRRCMLWRQTPGLGAVFDNIGLLFLVLLSRVGHNLSRQ